MLQYKNITEQLIWKLCYLGKAISQKRQCSRATSLIILWSTSSTYLLVLSSGRFVLALPCCGPRRPHQFFLPSQHRPEMQPRCGGPAEALKRRPSQLSINSTMNLVEHDASPESANDWPEYYWMSDSPSTNIQKKTTFGSIFRGWRVVLFGSCTFSRWSAHVVKLTNRYL